MDREKDQGTTMIILLPAEKAEYKENFENLEDEWLYWMD